MHGVVPGDAWGGVEEGCDAWGQFRVYAHVPHAIGRYQLSPTRRLVKETGATNGKKRKLRQKQRFVVDHLLSEAELHINADCEQIEVSWALLMRIVAVLVSDNL